MNYTIQLGEQDRFINVVAKGGWDLDTARAMSRKVMEKVDASSVGRVLVDMRKLIVREPIIQLYERAMELWEERQKYRTVSMKVAIVFTFVDPDFESNMRFFETAARNRGLPYRVFGDMDEAKMWLLPA
jgi:hypothetical protein